MLTLIEPVIFRTAIKNDAQLLRKIRANKKDLTVVEQLEYIQTDDSEENDSVKIFT